MKYARLVWVNLTRNKRRTILTMLSVAAALFLFVSLRSVVTALEDAGEVGSETRMITRSASPSSTTSHTISPIIGRCSRWMRST